MQETVGWIIRKFQANGNTRAMPNTPEWRELARAMAAIELESVKRTAERDDGDFSGQPEHPLLKEPEVPATTKNVTAARILSDDSTKTLDELVLRFLAERKLTGAMENEHRVSVRMFHEFLGEPKPVYQITRRDVQGYKGALLETPSNYTKRFPGVPLPDAIKANKQRREPFATLNPRTINDKWLSNLHALLGWCVRTDIIPDNPAAGIKVDAKQASKPPHVPFTPGDLTKIFAPPMFDRKKPFGELLWAMLIALFSGMRPSEIAQLKLDSIRHERDVLVFVVEEETKNIGSRRLIPVHSKLLGFGLEDRITSWTMFPMNRYANEHRNSPNIASSRYNLAGSDMVRY